MKKSLLLLLLLPALIQAQSKQIDSEETMRKFQQYYNAGMGDSINTMFGHNWDQMKAFKPIWTNKDNAEMLEKFGKLEAFKFIGIDRSDPQKVYVFQTIFTKGGEKTTSLTLDKVNDLSTFRFITESRSITKLLNKYHRSVRR